MFLQERSNKTQNKPDVLKNDKNGYSILFVQQTFEWNLGRWSAGLKGVAA